MYLTFFVLHLEYTINYLNKKKDKKQKQKRYGRRRFKYNDYKHLLLLHTKQILFNTV